MAVNHPKWKVFGPFFTVVWSSILASLCVSAERSLKQEYLSGNSTWVPNQDPEYSDFLRSSVNFLWQADKSRLAGYGIRLENHCWWYNYWILWSSLWECWGRRNIRSYA